MAEQANLEEDKASWTIKSVPVETRKLAVACAAKQGQTMAEWLAKAVRTQANLERRASACCRRRRVLATRWRHGHRFPPS